MHPLLPGAAPQSVHCPHRRPGCVSGVLLIVLGRGQFPPFGAGAAPGAGQDLRRCPARTGVDLRPTGITAGPRHHLPPLTVTADVDVTTSTRAQTSVPPVAF